MTVYLDVWDTFDGKFIGVLEMRHHILNEQVVQTYEFIGNAASDGGIWEWIAGANRAEVHLFSNIRKVKAALLRSTNWGKGIPPPTPWFTDPTLGSINSLVYFTENNSSRTFEWYLKK